MEELLSGLRAVAEVTRLRLLFVLSHGEFNVSELTQILGQSQPRISRHLKLMAEAGLLDRYKEGSWVLFRLRDAGVGGALARMIADLLPGKDSLLAGDRQRMMDVRDERAARAAAYFSANAAQWDQLRSLHVAEHDVEQAILRLAGSGRFRLHLDLGTGTGRMLQLFSGSSDQAIGIDSSHEMLAIARSNIERTGHRHIQVRHADIYGLPFSTESADLVTIHQVLHYLEEPARALAEAARVLKPGGRLILVDFAPHDVEQLREQHAHRRLGLAHEQVQGWLERAGLELAKHELLPPPQRPGDAGLTVALWLARNRRRNAPHPMLESAEGDTP
jgi:ubiquinone/menaquinone biosynthesis C-methylase UbiE